MQFNKLFKTIIRYLTHWYSLKWCACMLIESTYPELILCIWSHCSFYWIQVTWKCAMWRNHADDCSIIDCWLTHSLGVQILQMKCFWIQSIKCEQRWNWFDMTLKSIFWTWSIIDRTHRKTTTNGSHCSYEWNKESVDLFKTDHNWLSIDLD